MDHLLKFDMYRYVADLQTFSFMLCWLCKMLKSFEPSTIVNQYYFYIYSSRNMKNSKVRNIC